MNRDLGNRIPIVAGRRYRRNSASSDNLNAYQDDHNNTQNPFDIALKLMRKTRCISAATAHFPRSQTPDGMQGRALRGRCTGSRAEGVPEQSAETAERTLEQTRPPGDLSSAGGSRINKKYLLRQIDDVNKKC
jgi:hypothetical protein